MLDNIDIAIHTKLNDLAERHGLQSYDFVATIRRNEAEGCYTLRFEVPASGNDLRKERFDRMLRDLGIGDDSFELKGTPAIIVDALNNALGLSPRPRLR